MPTYGLLCSVPRYQNVLHFLRHNIFLLYRLHAGVDDTPVLLYPFQSLAALLRNTISTA